MKRILKYLLIAALIYAIYFIATGVIPFLHGKELPEDYKSSINASDFYNDEQCYDRVALVEDPLTSLKARVYMITQAEHTLDISYYGIDIGETADLILSSVIDAADRGVKVRILIDGMSGGLTNKNRDYAQALGAHENIELKLYNTPNYLKPWTVNGRLHDKYIIVDNKLLLLGGRNLGDKYFNPEGFKKNLSIDRDILVYNSKYDSQDDSSVLFSVRKYMDEIWAGEDVSEPFTKDSKKGIARRQYLKDIFIAAHEKFPELFDHDENYYESTMPANRITFLHNDTNIGVKSPKVGYAIAKLLLSAEKSVFIQSPYIVLDKNSNYVLSELGKKDLCYEVLTNSLASSPNPLAYSAYMADRKKLIDMNTEIYEYQSKHSIHSKTFVVDERITIIGSYNLDPRSAYIDTELMLAVDSEDFTSHMREVLAEYQDDSLLVDKDGDYIPNPELEPQAVSPIKHALFSILSVIVRPFKFLV